MDVSERDRRTTPIGLARYAREYYDAAIAADHVIGHRPGYEIHAPAPVNFLVAHSIELALKSYLRHEKFTVAEIIKIGHSLTRCWTIACDHDIAHHVDLDESDLDVLRVIDVLHTSTELRYIVTGYKELPVFGPLQVLATKLLDGICPLVGFR